MRFAGRISGWNEDRGYGFVVPHDGGERAFVHAKAFPFGSRRPIDGDLISYTVTKDERGRTNAKEVLLAGQRIEQRGHATPLPRLAISAFFLLAVILGTVLGPVPAVIAIVYGVLSLLSYLMYSADKSAATRNRQRVPESTLHAVDLFGGWPGALIAQQRLRHKIIKSPFQKMFWITALINLAAAIWLVRSGLAESLSSLLLGG